MKISDIFYDVKLGDVLRNKSQNLNIVRFVAVLMVIVSNSFLVCTGSETGEWLFLLTNKQITMARLGMAILFLYSGFLIAMSAEKNKTINDFFMKRIKRVFPSFVFVTVGTVIICSFVSAWKPAGYIISIDTWKYLLNCVFIRVRELPGVFSNHPISVVNGLYWTIATGVICYIFCFIAYKLKFLEKKRFPISVPLVVIGSFIVWKLSARYTSLEAVIQPVLFFYIGVAYWVYREKIALTVQWFVGSLVLLMVFFALGIGEIAMFMVFPYITMYVSFGMRQCSTKIGQLGNYAYGTYLWGFTVQQLALHFWTEDVMYPKYNVLIALPISILFGVLTHEIVVNNTKGIPIQIKNFRCPDIIYVVLMMAYAMRFVDWGLDLWDTGYSYSNFQYMSLSNMDSMWYFSTYLANVVGNFLTKLPFANTLLGMNFYTKLFIIVLVLIGYFFCTKTLKMSRWIVFIGELVTLSLSWCPSSVLYNYMTYILVVLCVIFLYRGLIKRNHWWLFLAGICLGVNILVRFSNLPQAVLIVAVWIYGFLEARECNEKGVLKETIDRTLWCISGWLSGLGVLLIYVHIKYGIGEYIEAILRLFGMTEAIENYTPKGMIDTVVEEIEYVLPWLKELVIYVFVGMAIWSVIHILKRLIPVVRDNFLIQKLLNIVGVFSNLYLIRSIVETLYSEAFCKVSFSGYEAIKWPAILFMVITVLLSIVKLVDKHVTKEEKLISLMIALLILINSIGSNNALFSSFNNLCLAAPYTLWNMYQYIRYAKGKVIFGISFSSWPIRAVLIGFLYVFLWQVGLFGQYFFYTEAAATSVVGYTVENNEVLKGIKMDYEKATWLTTISKYVNENNLKGREIVLYGHIPSMSYYLQMPPAFNSWPALDSYNITQLSKDIQELQAQMDSGEIEPPVVLIEGYRKWNTKNGKWQLIEDFIKTNNYECTFYNGKFVLYETTVK